MKKIAYLDFISELLVDKEQLELFKNAYQKRIPKSAKLLLSRFSKSDFLDYFSHQKRRIKAPNFTSKECIYDDVLFAEKEGKQTLGQHFLHQLGLFYVQEVSAGFSAQVLNPQKGDIVLDLCAAPGGKSVQLADKLLRYGAGFVLANEPSNPRRKALIFNLNRCGLANSGILAYNGVQIGDLAKESFDKVLVDAPCSGEGMQYKHDKTVHIRDQKGAEKLSKLQIELLISGLKSLKVGGELVYSTCTLNPLENEAVIHSVLEKYGDALALENVDINEKSNGLQSFKNQNFLSLEQSKKVARFRPHIQQTGGFFIAKFRKNHSIPTSISQDKRKLKSMGIVFDDAMQTKVWNYLLKNWEIEKNDQFFFFSTDSAIYITTKEVLSLPSSLFIEKIGVPIFKIGFKGDWIAQQGLATVLGSFAHKNCCSLSDEEAQLLSDIQSLKGNFGAQGEFLIAKWKEVGAFLVKQGDGIVKGKF